MVAKIIASGPDRETARLRLIEALRNTVLFGTPCNREFLLACLENPCFAAGEATTAFIAEEFGKQGFATQPVTIADSAAAAVVDLALDHRTCAEKSLLVAPALRDWSNASPLVSRKQYAHGEALHDLSVSPLGNQRYTVSAAAETHEIVVQELGDPLVRLTRNGESLIACYHADPQGRLYLSVNGQAGEYRDLIPEDGLTDNTAGSGDVTAPMHGLLQKILVSSGDQVAVGDTLAVLEAMKMHYEITAEVDGEVTEIVASAGTQVAADELLLQITAAEQ
jgi:geranyl-CoA carboxylase alpha subunit